jgi:hypothetical protein
MFHKGSNSPSTAMNTTQVSFLFLFAVFSFVGRLRQQIGLEENDSAVVFTLKCLPNATQEDLTDFSDFVKVLVKSSGMLEEADAPISAVTRMKSL